MQGWDGQQSFFLIWVLAGQTKRICCEDMNIFGVINGGLLMHPNGYLVCDAQHIYSMTCD